MHPPPPHHHHTVPPTASFLSPWSCQVLRLSVASYLRPPPAPRLRRAQWWESEPWLARLANLRATDAAQRARLCAVEALLVGGGGRRSFVKPARSSLFEWVDERLPQPLPGDADPAVDPATARAAPPHAALAPPLCRDRVACFVQPAHRSPWRSTALCRTSRHPRGPS